MGGVGDAASFPRRPSATTLLPPAASSSFSMPATTQLLSVHPTRNYSLQYLINFKSVPTPFVLLRLYCIPPYCTLVQTNQTKPNRTEPNRTEPITAAQCIQKTGDETTFTQLRTPNY